MSRRFGDKDHVPGCPSEDAPPAGDTASAAPETACLLLGGCFSHVSTGDRPAPWGTSEPPPVASPGHSAEHGRPEPRGSDASGPCVCADVLMSEPHAAPAVRQAACEPVHVGPSPLTEEDTEWAGHSPKRSLCHVCLLQGVAPRPARRCRPPTEGSGVLSRPRCRCRWPRGAAVLLRVPRDDKGSLSWKRPCSPPVLPIPGPRPTDGLAPCCPRTVPVRPDSRGRQPGGGTRA